jgi:tetratricopeptide (TPR) repeat protein
MIKRILLFSWIICFLLQAGQGLSDERYGGLLRSRPWKDMVSKGEVYLEAGLYDKAVEYFQQVARMYPYISEAQYYLGYVYYKKGDLARAEKTFNRSLKLDPEFVLPYYYLALIHYEKGLPEDALAFFERVTDMDPGFQSAYYNKGVVLRDIGRETEAVKEFAYSLYLDPEDTRAFKAIVSSYTRMTGAGPKSKKNIPTESLVTPVTAETGFSGKHPADNIITLSTGEEGESSYEVEFIPPEDISSGRISLQIKGSAGGEKVMISLRDDMTRRSPFSSAGEITREWKRYTLDPAKEFSMYMDPAITSGLKIELRAGDKNDRSGGQKIFLRDIKVISK